MLGSVRRVVFKIVRNRLSISNIVISLNHCSLALPMITTIFSFSFLHGGDARALAVAIPHRLGAHANRTLSRLVMTLPEALQL